jgi:hypothetical protein
VQGYSRVLKVLTRLGVLRIQRMQRNSVLASTPRVPLKYPSSTPWSTAQRVPRSTYRTTPRVPREYPLITLEYPLITLE